MRLPGRLGHEVCNYRKSRSHCERKRDSVKRTASVLSANIINHIGLILDASGSMSTHAKKLIEVADNQIAHLATRSKELDQETRISVWTFSDHNDIKCVVWDKDVLRLPSIARYYRISGMTAFVDAAMMSLHDMATTSQIYGDHSFLLYYLTDGYENNSRKYGQNDLIKKIGSLDDNWTLAALVPGPNEMMEAKKLGFPAGNVQIWNSTAVNGIEVAGKSITDSTDAYMTARATGMRSTTSLFDMSSTSVNKKTIKASGLKPLPSSSYLLVPVPADARIDEFTASMGHTFIVGRGYYQLSTRLVDVQAQKEIAVVEKTTNKVFTGQAARAMIGLPDTTVRIKAGHNPDFDIYIQSTSINRKLIAGTKYLYLPRQNS